MLRVISACVIGAIVALVFPVIFGEEYGTRQVARVIAPFVGASYESTARDDITVLLIDDQALTEADEGWPPSLSFYAKILNDVASFGPKAIFVDLIFSSDHPDSTAGELKKVLEDIHKGPVKVFLAASLDDKRKLSVRDELDGLATKVAVEYNPDDLDHVVWNYPMTKFRHEEAPPEGATTEEATTEHEAGAEHGNDSKPRSAALAIYESLYGKVEDPEDDLALTWGLFPAPDGLKWTKVKSHDGKQAAGKEHRPAAGVFGEDYELYCDESEHAAPLILGAISHALVAKRGKPVCVFHHTLYQREMLYPNKAQNNRLDWLLKDRIVMIGTAFSYSNDIVFSPLHDRVPGVYLHAMALDNLITRGPDYPRAVEFDEPRMTGAYPRVLLLLVLGGLCVYVLTRFKERWIEPWKEKCRPLEKESEPVEIDETLVATAREPGAAPREAGRAASVAMHVHASQKRRPHISPSNRFFARLMEGSALTMLKLLEVTASLVMVGIVVFAGQRVLNVAYLAIAHVTLFALAAEWFEWNNRLVDWYFGEEEKP